MWRDDKNYFYVGMTNEDYPKISISHQPTISKPKISFVGPFVDGAALKQTLKILRKVFPYRSCNRIPTKSCLWYHLNRCPAPCLLKSKFIEEIPKDYLKLKRTAQQNANNLIRILREGENPVLKDLKKEMKSASKNEDFEAAAKIRNQINYLEKTMEHAKIFELQAEKSNWPEIEKRLKGVLNSKKKMTRIEAYDISNIQGQSASGSMITFIDGFPDKNFYRKFKIKISGKPDDMAMIKEVLSRRFNHSEWPYPDLILIDGGKGQLNAAKVVIERLDNLIIPVIALAKKKNELYIENRKNPILLKSLSREIFNLILQLRDEAHRFAKGYHHKLRDKALINW